MRVRVFSALFVMVLLGIGVARAQSDEGVACEKPREVGMWLNRAAGVKDVSSVEIEYFCPEDPVFGAWRVRLKTRCHPRDCTWGWSPAERGDDDTLRVGYQGFYTTVFLTLRLSAGDLLAEAEMHVEDEAPDIRYYRLRRK